MLEIRAKLVYQICQTVYSARVRHHVHCATLVMLQQGLVVSVVSFLTVNIMDIYWAIVYVYNVILVFIPILVDTVLPVQAQYLLVHHVLIN